MRWIATLPAAFLTGYIAWFFVGAIYKHIASTSIGLDPNSAISRIVFEAASQIALGYFFVAGAEAVAPNHKGLATHGASLLGFLISGFLFMPALLKMDQSAMLGVAATLVGLTLAAKRRQQQE